MATIQDLFEERVGEVLLRQDAFSELLGDHSFRLGLDEGIIDFGEKGKFKIQLLGTYSNDDQSWLWGWAHEGVSDELKAHVSSVRLLGEQKDIFELTGEEVFVDEADPELLAIVSTGEAGCYYRAPHTKGDVFVLVNDVPVPKKGSYGVDAIERVLELISSTFSPNMKRVTLALLGGEGFTIGRSDDEFTAKRSSDNASFRMEFDADGGILSLVSE